MRDFPPHPENPPQTPPFLFAQNKSRNTLAEWSLRLSPGRREASGAEGTAGCGGNTKRLNSCLRRNDRHIAFLHSATMLRKKLKKPPNRIFLKVLWALGNVKPQAGHTPASHTGTARSSKRPVERTGRAGTRISPAGTVGRKLSGGSQEAIRKFPPFLAGWTTHRQPPE